MSDGNSCFGESVIEDLSPLVFVGDPLRNKRRRFAKSPPPTNLPPMTGLQLWFAPGLGQYQDFPGSTAVAPAAANNDPVGRWEDQSGNGRHATQTTTSGFRPLLKTALIDTYSGANPADSTFHGLELASLYALTGDFTIYCVGKRAASKKFVPVGSKTSWTIVTVWEDNTIYVGDDAGGGAARTLSYTGGAGSIICRWTRTGTGNPRFKGGGMADTAMAGSGSGNGDINISSITARTGLNAGSSADGIVEVLVYSTNDTSTKSDAETYLATKYPSASF